MTLLHFLNPKFIKRHIAPVVNIKIYTPTEATKGDVLLYVSEELNFKPRPDLNIYEWSGTQGLLNARESEFYFTGHFLGGYQNVSV